MLRKNVKFMEQHIAALIKDGASLHFENELLKGI